MLVEHGQGGNNVQDTGSWAVQSRIEAISRGSRIHVPKSALLEDFRLNKVRKKWELKVRLRSPLSSVRDGESAAIRGKD